MSVRGGEKPLLPEFSVTRNQPPMFFSLRATCRILSADKGARQWPLLEKTGLCVGVQSYTLSENVPTAPGETG